MLKFDSCLILVESCMIELFDLNNAHQKFEDHEIIHVHKTLMLSLGSLRLSKHVGLAFPFFQKQGDILWK